MNCMRKILFFVISTGISLGMMAQGTTHPLRDVKTAWAAGFKGGVNINNTTTTSSNVNVDGIDGPHLGFVFQKPISSGLGIRASLMFSAQGYRIQYDYPDSTNPNPYPNNYHDRFERSFLDFPITLHYTMTSGLGAFAGIQPSVIFSQTDYYENNSGGKFSAVMGLSYIMKNGFGFEAAYVPSFTTYRFGYYYGQEPADLKTDLVQVSGVYFFGIAKKRPVRIIL